MILKDLNRSLKAPEGFEFLTINPQGNFLVLEYKRERFFTNSNVCSGYDYVNIYLNDSGREVVRAEWTSDEWKQFDKSVDAVSNTAPLCAPGTQNRSRWNRFLDLFDRRIS